MANDDSSQTAYQYNSAGNNPAAEIRDYGWCATINRLLQQRYAFLPQQYEDGGYLFRGMSNGLSAALLADRFHYFTDDSSVARFEQELGIVCVSQDFSDAYSVSRLWEHNPDACIVATKASLFNTELNSRQAAIMATAEPGVVFRYPFYTRPLKIRDIELIIVSPLFLSAMKTDCLRDVNPNLAAEECTLLQDLVQELIAMNKMVACPEIYERSPLEKELVSVLNERVIHGASLVPSSLVPKRQ